MSESRNVFIFIFIEDNGEKIKSYLPSPRARQMSEFLRYLLLLCSTVMAMLSVSNATNAESSPRLYGELIACSNTTINGVPAVSGVSIQNNDLLSAGERGGALIRVGTLGRIELGPRSELKIEFSDRTLRGELRKGKAVINLRRGVSIELKTSKGMVVADGQIAARLKIDLEHESAVFNHLQMETSPDQTVTARMKTSRLIQFVRGFESSAGAVLGKNGRIGNRYESTITCLENETFACRKVGAVTP